MSKPWESPGFSRGGAVKCFHTHVRPVGEVHVTHFRPQEEFSGLCPHYMEWTGDGD